LQEETNSFHKQAICVRFIGDRSRLDPRIVEKMDAAEALTKDNQAMVLVIAIDYGGQWDIYQSVKTLLYQIQNKEFDLLQLTPADISNRLSLSDLPDPDLMIRTSGEKRVSNFMLWQLAYTELYFTDTLWPDFDTVSLSDALKDYANRERRFGSLNNKEKNVS
jgi:undecaprenyl diphosphate synthase